jgi:hypothetical protein
MMPLGQPKDHAMARTSALLAAAALLVLGSAAFAATTPAKPIGTPRPYAPPKVQVEDTASCLAVTIERGGRGATIMLRNVCALRVNWAMCVRRSDDRKPMIAKGSLSPAAVAEEIVLFTAKTRTFAHSQTFCSGIVCEVATPEC